MSTAAEFVMWILWVTNSNERGTRVTTNITDVQDNEEDPGRESGKAMPKQAYSGLGIGNV